MLERKEELQREIAMYIKSEIMKNGMVNPYSLAEVLTNCIDFEKYVKCDNKSESYVPEINDTNTYIIAPVPTDEERDYEFKDAPLNIPSFEGLSKIKVKLKHKKFLCKVLTSDLQIVSMPVTYDFEKKQWQILGFVLSYIASPSKDLTPKRQTLYPKYNPF